MPKLQKYSAMIPTPLHQIHLLALPWLHIVVPPPFSTTPEHDVLVAPCQSHRNAVCRCEDGYYRSYIDSETYECVKCRRCDPTEKESQKCESSNERSAARRLSVGCVDQQMKCDCGSLLRTGSPEKNTVCQCEDNYYRHNNKCEPCSKCVDLFMSMGKFVFRMKPTAECHLFHFCSLGKQKRSWGVYTRLRLCHTLYLKDASMLFGEIFLESTFVLLVRGCSFMLMSQLIWSHPRNA